MGLQLGAGLDLRASEPQASDETTDESGLHGASETTRNIFGLHAAPLNEPLVTDRPDFTESAVAIPWGHAQLEAGYTFTYDREHADRVRDHTLPEFLLRVGVVEDFELRFGWSGYSGTSTHSVVMTPAGHTVGREQWSSGANDLELGLKLKFADQDGWQPDLALLGSLTVPIGTRGFSSDDVEPSLGLLWAYDLTDRAALAGQFVFSAPTEAGDRFFQSAASLSLGYSLTEQIGAYIEYYGFYPNSEHTDCAHTIDGGLTFLVDSNFQIDVRAGFGLNEEADDFFAGIGFAWRF